MPSSTAFTRASSLIGPPPGLSPFQPGCAHLAYHGLLPSFLGAAGFEQVPLILADDINGLKSLQFAGAVADTFDQYTLYRPEMIMSWERGEGEGWQPPYGVNWPVDSKSESHRARC